MGIFDNEMILPGVITNIISDYNSGYDVSQFGKTDSVTVIGTAFNGPVGKPVAVYSPEHAKYIFGPSFDSKTKREATLVSEIEDAWERGCRTIYAVRISGQEMYKDFKLATYTDCKLRVSGIFPHNGNKEVFFQYDSVDTIAKSAAGAEPAIKIFKPASRATIEEKVQGKVSKDSSVLVSTINLKSSWNITSSTRLVDFIRSFNSFKSNNVLRLSIVGKNGDDVTETTEAQSLSFGDMFPGVYFIGRDRNAAKVIPTTLTESVFVPEEDRDSIYEGFQGNVFTTLKINSDITSEYPIYGKDATLFNKLIDKVGQVTMVKMFDFLQIPGKSEALWLKDRTDYEQVDLKDFEAYKLLGSGFANTAKIVETKEGSKVYKVVEVTSEADENRVIPINEGIYSMLENLDSDYRVLTGKYADTKIKGMLPNKKEFLIANPVNSEIFSDTISVSPIIDRKDISTIAKSYEFELNKLSDDSDILSKDMLIEGLQIQGTSLNINKYALNADGSVSEKLSLIKAEEIPEGTYVMFTDAMYKKVSGKLVACTDTSEFANSKIIVETALYQLDPEQESKVAFKAITATADIHEANYVVAEVGEKEVVFEVIKHDSTVSSVEPIANLDDVLKESSSIFSTIVPTLKLNKLVYVAAIRALNLEATSLTELVTMLNEDEFMSSKFVFDIGHTISEANKAEAIIPNIFAEPHGDLVNTAVCKINSGKASEAILDRGLPVYDRSLYIPYRTTDNFARQLAQHCTYTGLKTAPTHGVIGCSRLISTEIKSIKDRVDALLDIDLNLYAKRPNGNDMLDRNNMPYPIGRCLSVTFFQHSVTGDNYTYISCGAAAYAGMVSVLPIDQSSTNQPINLEDLRFELTNYQLGRLTQAGFVTVKDSYTKGLVITDGVTMAPATSSFRRLSVTRIINAIDEAIRASAEPYIGKQNHLSNRNSLQTSIKSKLDKMIGSLIDDYDFKLAVDKEAERMGIIEIDYTIRPIYEIREVRNKISVKDN